MRRIINSHAGFSLIEMLIVMVVFVVVMMITSSALNIVLTRGNIVQRSEESNIEGVIGLEMLRHDLAQAGLGLFTNTDDAPIYNEAAAAAVQPVLGSVPALYNDSTRTPNTPRAIVAGNNLLLADNVVLNGTDYLAIKATTVGNNAPAQRWTYVADDGIPHQWGTDDFVTGERMIALSQTFNAKRGVIEHSLVLNAGNFEVLYPVVPSIPFAAYTPSTNMRYYFYGINTAGGATLRAPFNRADYYVRRPDIGFPTSCSPATGVLYKGVMTHGNDPGDGIIWPEMPILDCVADLQIVLGWNTQANPEGSNAIDAFSDASGINTTPVNALAGIDITDPAEVRKRLRQIRVYILVQDGARDPNFVNINTALPLVGLTPANDNGEGGLVQRAGQAVPGSVDLTTPNMLNYRWKVYRVVVKPKNLG